MFEWVCAITHGTVHAEDDPPLSDREQEAMGAGWALHYHLAYEYGGPEAVRSMPGGEAWLAKVNEHPDNERHLAVHRDHLVTMNDADHAAWNAGGTALAEQFTVTGTADQVRERVARLGEAGVTEIAYQPLGSDIAGELQRFIAAAQ